MKEIKTTEDVYSGKVEYVESLELTEEVLLRIVKQNPLNGGYLRTRSFNPQESTFTLEIKENFVDSYGELIKHNNVVVYGDLIYIKKAFLELSRKYREFK